MTFLSGKWIAPFLFGSLAVCLFWGTISKKVVDRTGELWFWAGRGHPNWRELKVTCYSLIIFSMFLLLPQDSLAEGHEETTLIAPILNTIRMVNELQPSCPKKTTLWSGDFSNGWEKRWGIDGSKGFSGRNNTTTIRTDGEMTGIRVVYPKGSYSSGGPSGGANFYAHLNIPKSRYLFLRYEIRFEDGFDFVVGGKLPGLYGGKGNTGGHIPNGKDGFSVRLFWGVNGRGGVYAYLPTSIKWGTGFRAESLKFIPGKWHSLELGVFLNDPLTKNGSIELWFDGKQVINAHGLHFRDVEELQIDGVLFSTFFGGGSDRWAAKKTEYAEFRNFSVSKCAKDR